MMIVMKAPPHRRGGKRILNVTPEQARILEAVGWTRESSVQTISPDTFQNEQDFFRSEGRAKRKYTRRTPKSKDRHYKRRDMQAEDDE
jgi:hypothetical protein